jgi:hypothetical protein
MWLAAATGLLLLGAAAPAQALVCNYQGPSEGDWRASAASWSCGKIPEAADDVILDGIDRVSIGTQNEAAATLVTGPSAQILPAAGRTLAVSGTWNAQGGSLRGGGTVSAGGAFTKTGPGRMDLRGATVVLNAASSITGGAVAVSVAQDGNGFMEINATFSVLEGADADAFPHTGNNGRIRINAPNGRFLKNSPGVTNVGRGFDNDDTVEIVQGDLTVAGGQGDNNQTGAWIVPALHTLRFSRGIGFDAAFNILSGSVTGGGTVVVDGGTLNMAPGSTFAVSRTEIVGGVLQGDGTGSTGELLLDTGTGGGAGTMTTGTLDARGGVLKGSGSTVVTSTFAKTTAGSLQLRLGANLTLNGPSSIELGEICIGFSADGGGSMDVGGTFTILLPGDTTPFRDCGNPGRLRVNAPDGRFVKNSPGVSTVGAHFDNDDTVEVLQGELNVANGAAGNQQSGAWLVPLGSVLRFSGGANVLGGSISGPGTVGTSGGSLAMTDGAVYDVDRTEISGGVLSIAGANGLAATDTLVMTGGERGGSRSLTAGSMEVTAGFLRAAGPTVVTGAFTKSGGGGLDLRGATLDLRGPSSIDGGHICVGVAQDGGGNVLVSGTLTLTGTSAPVPVQDCGNAGTLTVQAPGGRIEVAGAAARTISAIVTNAGGTIFAAEGRTLTLSALFTQTSGSTVVAPTGLLQANMTASDGTVVAAGTLGGNLTLTGEAVLTGGGNATGLVTNTSGTVRPGSSPGHLTVGSYTQGALGELVIEIAGTGQGTTYDWLGVTGAAALDGKVEAALLGGFDPALTDVFQFLTSGSRTGTFDSPPVFEPLPGGKTFLLDHPASAPLGARLLLQAPPAPDNTGIPVIDGTVAVGSVVTCVEGQWTNDPAFTYRWLSDGVAIGGATSRTFTITGAQATHQLTCEVTGTNLGGSDTATSAPVLVPAAPPVNTAPPAITGTPASGQTLVCNAGTWSGAPAPTFTYEWLRDGVVIATGTTYVAVAADERTSLTCRETATNGAGSAAVTSAPLAVPAPAAPAPSPTPAPTPAPVVVQPPTAEEKLVAAPPSQVATAFGLPSSRRCVSRRNFTIRLRSPRGVKIKRAIVTVGTKTPRVRKAGGRFVATVDLRGLPKGRFRVKIRILTTSGKTILGSRRYRTCAPRSRG